MSKSYTSIVPLPGESLDDTYKVFSVSGDSMSPGIKPGALLLVKEIPRDEWGGVKGVAVFSTWKGTCIRRIGSNLIDTERQISLIPDNPDYPAELLASHEIRAVYKAIRKIHEYID